MVKGKNFKEVTFHKEKILISGRMLAGKMPMRTKTEACGDIEPKTGSRKTMDFVKLTAGEHWLLCTTTGQSRVGSSSFGRTNLLSRFTPKPPGSRSRTRAPLSSAIGELRSCSLHGEQLAMLVAMVRPSRP